MPYSHRLVLAGAALAAGVPFAIVAQAPASVPRASGTVKAVTGTGLTLATEAGAQVAVTLGPGTKVLIVPPGSKDLKAATQAAVADIAVGDRALVNGMAGDAAGALTAARVILIKSTALAARNESEQADWQRRGTGGIVKSVSGAEISVAAGARTLLISTTPGTQFRRYADDSVDFSNSKASTLAGVHVGDQLRVRGDRSADGSSIHADEIVTGTFDNLSGLLTAVNAGDGTLTLKDLATKKVYVIKVTANSQLHSLPPEAAQMLAARNHAGAPGAAASAGAGTHGSAAPTPAPAGTGAAGAPETAGVSTHRRGGDLSQMLQRFPLETMAELKPGMAVMIVATQNQAGGEATAITLLSGVESLLTASPGADSYTLAPWSLAAPDAGAGGGGGA